MDLEELIEVFLSLKICFEWELVWSVDCLVAIISETARYRTTVGFVVKIDKLRPEHNVKVSYRWVPNMGRYLARHNAKILSKSYGGKKQRTPKCNCQKSRKGEFRYLVSAIKRESFTKLKLTFRTESLNSTLVLQKISKPDGEI